MTLQVLQRCDAELRPLEPRDGSSAAVREQVRAFNENVAEVRAALLEPAKDLLERGTLLQDLAACLEKAVAEIAFWRRVLWRMYGDALGSEPAPSDCLLRYVMG